MNLIMRALPVPSLLLALLFAATSPALSASTPTVPATGLVVRSTLTADEQGAAQPVNLPLTFRNLDELAARVERGDLISPAEMAERYYPTHETWVAVAEWAKSHGLAVGNEDRFHLAVAATGSAAQVDRAFNAHLARVLSTDGHEYTAAINPVEVPSDIRPSVAAVLGLQPHIKLKTAAVYNPASSNLNAYGPQYLLDQYHASGDGTGQIIAVFGFDKVPNTTDLTTYWQKIGSPHTMADVTILNPYNYPVYDDNGAVATTGPEVTMDTEIVSGLCPNAQVRVYCYGNDVASYALFAQAVINDLPAYPQIHQANISSAQVESLLGSASASQYFMALAAQGVTTFASSGDAGSNPLNGGVESQSYSPTAPLEVEYPASDPYVTGVGGTTQFLSLETPNSNYSPATGVVAEVAWTELTNPGWSINGVLQNNLDGSGGGLSTLFPRPAWQTGPGLPAGNKRAVPDVAAAASGNSTGLFIYVGSDGFAGGTSESSPIWTGLCALLNQQLLASGNKPLGLLGPKLYPLAGSQAMHYVPQGYISYLAVDSGLNFVDNTYPTGMVDTNGAYNVGPTYDCITGIGYPNIDMIAQALETPPPGLTASISPQLPQGSVANGSAAITLTATATGNPTGFQWELNGVPIPGATTTSLTVPPTAASEGTYSLIVTNAAGAYTATAGSLSVSTTSWLGNLSARAYSETGAGGADQLIAGYVTTGPDNKSILIRGDGPTLASFNVTGFLPDPQLTLVSGSTVVSTTDSWAPSLASVFTQVGAFSLPSGSHDTALLETLPAGPYTAEVVSATNNNGVALAEIYDADSLAPLDRLVNISARAYVGTGVSILIGGFVIEGSSPLTVIIRGDGPALSGFGVTGALANTSLTLTTSGGALIASNSGWSTAPVAGPAATGGIVIQPLTSALAAKVGAFPLHSGSNDSAIVATLPPGAYTAQVTGANGTTGIALVEVYEVR